jgi:hypothetical protein
MEIVQVKMQMMMRNCKFLTITRFDYEVIELLYNNKLVVLTTIFVYFFTI